MKLVFAPTYMVAAYEPYVKAFQYKILTLILYTKKKLFINIMVIDSSTNLPLVKVIRKIRPLFHCFLSNTFWKHFEKYHFMLTKNLEFSAFKI